MMLDPAMFDPATYAPSAPPVPPEALGMLAGVPLPRPRPSRDVGPYMPLPPMGAPALPPPINVGPAPGSVPLPQPRPASAPSMTAGLDPADMGTASPPAQA